MKTLKVFIMCVNIIVLANCGLLEDILIEWKSTKPIPLETLEQMTTDEFLSESKNVRRSSLYLYMKSLDVHDGIVNVLDVESIDKFIINLPIPEDVLELPILDVVNTTLYHGGYYENR